MINLSAEATYGDKQPLEALSRLMAKRCEVLHETARDSAVATMITAIDSIRAATRKAKPNAKTKPKIELRDELVPSTHRSNSYFVKKSGHSGVFVLRNRLGHRVPMRNLRVRRLEDEGVPLSQQHVFRVVPMHRRDKPYFAVALNRANVLKYEENRSAGRKRQIGGLAQYTLGLAMQKLSTRNVSFDAGPRAKAAAPKFVQVSTSVMGHEMAIEMRDTLDYALAALKGGPSDVAIALKKAANKIAGRLQHVLHQSGNLAQDIPTPFPELVGKRRAP